MEARIRARVANGADVLGNEALRQRRAERGGLAGADLRNHE